MGAVLNKKRGPPSVTAFKILVVGSSQSGKTSIIQRYTSNQFLAGAHEPTRLVQLTTHTVRVPGRKMVPVAVTFWEVPSASLPAMKEKYYSEADGVLVVVDASAAVSGTVDCVKEAVSWKEDVCVGGGGGQCLPFMLLVNKADQTRDISELREASGDNGFVTCVEVFPRDGGESVFAAVDGLLRLLVDQRRLCQRDSFYPTIPSHSDLTVSKQSLGPVLPPDVTLTGAQEQDSLISLCWREVGYINRFSSALQRGVANFERESLHENVISEKEAREVTAIEHCIAGLRERLPSRCELHVVGGNRSESAVFPQLKITDKCLFQSSHEALKLLYIYHTEIYPPGNHLLQDTPMVLAHIHSCKGSLAKLQESEGEAAGATLQGVPGAMAMMESWEREVEESVRRVKVLAQRIQVAALWNSHGSTN